MRAEPAVGRPYTPSQLWLRGEGGTFLEYAEGGAFEFTGTSAVPGRRDTGIEALRAAIGGCAGGRDANGIIGGSGPTLDAGGGACQLLRRVPRRPASAGSIEVADFAQVRLQPTSEIRASLHTVLKVEYAHMKRPQTIRAATMTTTTVTGMDICKFCTYQA